MTTVLVVGGAGYIGSHMVCALLEQGYQVVTFDNLCAGHRDAVIGGQFVQGDLANTADLQAVFARWSLDAVMHFAAFAQVGESVAAPAKYYRNNVVATLNLLEAMRLSGVSRFIFSSTGATFGEPAYRPMDEAHPQRPINPYGRTKWMVEQILRDYDQAYGLRSVCLRYFNAAGADPAGRLGERHDPETHLIPLALRVAAGRLPALTVYGRDYPTPDGTCIRDYVHVTDLCQAHLRALERLLNGDATAVYNLGNGEGFSVQQVISAARDVTGRPLATIDAPRRPGDPSHLVADSRLARSQLGWTPRYPELHTMIAHAWQWMQRETP